MSLRQAVSWGTSSHLAHPGWPVVEVGRRERREGTPGGNPAAGGSLQRAAKATQRSPRVNLPLEESARDQTRIPAGKTLRETFMYVCIILIFLHSCKHHKGRHLVEGLRRGNPWGLQQGRVLRFSSQRKPALSVRAQEGVLGLGLGRKERLEKRGHEE